MSPEWVVGTLDSVVARIRAGYSAPGEDRPARHDEAGVLKTGSVLDHNFKPSENKAVVVGIEKLRIPVRAGTVIVGRKNSAESVGASAYVGADHPNLYLSDLLWEIEVRAATDPRWLGYALAHDETRERIRLGATGTQSTMKNLSRESFLQIPLDIPPFPEQRKITEILGAWDHAIETLAKTAALKRAALKSLSANAFDAARSSTINPIRLGELFDERAETTSTSLPLLSVTQQNGVVRQQAAGRKDSSSSDRSRYKRVLPGDIAYNTMRMWQGASGLVGEEGIVSPAYTVVAPRASSIDANYAALLFKDDRMKFDFERYSQGLTSDTWNLKYPAFAEIRVSIPALDTQRRFATYLQTANDELALIDREIALLKEQKRGLMQKLLTGDIRVSVGSAEEAHP